VLLAPLGQPRGASPSQAYRSSCPTTLLATCHVFSDRVAVPGSSAHVSISELYPYMCGVCGEGRGQRQVSPVQMWRGVCSFRATREGKISRICFFLRVVIGRRPLFAPASQVACRCVIGKRPPDFPTRLGTRRDCGGLRVWSVCSLGRFGWLAINRSSDYSSGKTFGQLDAGNPQ
jgi:hypothetical protein